MGKQKIKPERVNKWDFSNLFCKKKFLWTISTSGIKYDDTDIEHFENETWSLNIYLSGEGNNDQNYDETDVITVCSNKEDPAEYLFYYTTFIRSLFWKVFILPFLVKTSVNEIFHRHFGYN